MLPLVLLGFANSVLGTRWVVSAWRHMAHADGMDEGIVGMFVLLGGLATVATGLLVLLLARKTRHSTRRRYLLALVLSFALGVLPWFAFVAIP
jgi:TRAP-type C4-dicarboxylate transport system permease small subunit